MRSTHAVVLALLITAATVYAAPAPCHLDRTVALAPYQHPDTATIEEWRDSRLAVEKLMDCRPESIDPQSRKTFFDVVRMEFTSSHSAETARWRKLYSRPHEGVDSAIGIFQTDIRRFMDGLVDRNDASSKDVILRYGDARAIAALRPSVKHDVLSMLGNGGQFYGLNHRYHPQLEAIQVLGLWIDPTNKEFSPAEKSDFTRTLVALLPHVQPGVNAYEDRYFQSALRALVHSDSLDAETALASWMDHQADHGSFLYHEAARSLTAVRARRGA